MVSLHPGRKGKGLGEAVLGGFERPGLYTVCIVFAFISMNGNKYKATITVVVGDMGSEVCARKASSRNSAFLR